MKKMVFTLATFASLVTQTAVAGNSMLLKSDLQNITVDSQLGANPVGGNLLFNSVNNTLSLTIHFAGHRCPPGNMCPAYMQPPLRTSELPVIDVTTDACGARIITAEENKMPVDGVLQRITITENSKNYCKYLGYVYPVEGQYSQQFAARQTEELITWNATFAGSPFKKHVNE